MGCCGFPTRQRDYYKLFHVVEIQHTFYQPPQLHTALRWREEAPQGFEFTIKAWQLITHEASSPTYRRLRMKLEPGRKSAYGRFQPTREVWDAWLITKDFAEALGAHIIVFQCPARFKPTSENKDNMRRFFERLHGLPFVFVWEPRGEWTDKDVAELCEELGLVHGVDPFQRQPVTKDFFYFRLHGTSGYKHKYTEFELARLAKECQKHRRGYCMFNNVYMLDDAQRFMSIIGTQKL